MFDLYVNYLGDEILDGWLEQEETMRVYAKDGHEEVVSVLDVLPTRMSDSGVVAIAAINKHASEARTLALSAEGMHTGTEYRLITVNGDSTDAYNDVDVNGVTLTVGEWLPLPENLQVTLDAHSVNVIQIR